MNILLPASTCSHRTSSLFQHSCLLAVDVVMTNFMHSSTSPSASYHEASFMHCASYSGFLGHCLPFCRCWGQPHPSPYCRYLPWEYCTHGCQGAGFHCCPGGHTLRYRRMLCPTMKHGDFPVSHSGSYLITWTPKRGHCVCHRHGGLCGLLPGLPVGHVPGDLPGGVGGGQGWAERPVSPTAG